MLDEEKEILFELEREKKEADKRYSGAQGQNAEDNFGDQTKIRLRLNTNIH